MTKLAYRFVPAVTQDKKQAKHIRREVRSHVARYTVQKGSNNTPTSGTRCKRRRHLLLRWSCEVVNDVPQVEISQDKIVKASPWHGLAGGDMIPASQSP